MNPYYQKDGVTVYHADFRDVQVDYGTTVDAVIADPPYGRQWGDWEGLGCFSSDVLVRGGSLLTIIPHYAVPEVTGTLSKWLKYRWLCAMWQHGGAHPRMAMGIEVTWKPIGWWVKDAWPQGRGYRIDGFKNCKIPSGKSRPKLHKWEQSMDWAEYCLKFVPPGGTIVDPMMGSGTLIVAARDQGFTVVGIDNDEAACETTVRRLEGSVS